MMKNLFYSDKRYETASKKLIYTRTCFKCNNTHLNDLFVGINLFEISIQIVATDYILKISDLNGIAIPCLFMKQTKIIY